MNFFITLDMLWLLLGALALILNYCDERARSICICLVLISTFGHIIHPFIKSMQNAYVYWELYGASINFLKLLCIYFVSAKFTDGVPRFALHISSILILGIAFRVIFYCSWVAWDSEVLVSTYRILIPAFNASILLLMLANGFRIRLERVRFKEDNGY